jgi:hypothetical protein
MTMRDFSIHDMTHTAMRVSSFSINTKKGLFNGH